MFSSNQIPHWSTNDEESAFLGACLEFFGRKSTHEKLINLLSCGVDESWFRNEKNKALFYGIAKTATMLGREGTIVGYKAIIEKTEEVYESRFPGSIGFADSLIATCKKSVSYFDYNDFVESDLSLWYNKLKSEEIRATAEEIVGLTSTSFTRESSGKILGLIQKAEDLWGSQPDTTGKSQALFSSVRDSVLAPKPENSHISTGLRVLDFILGGGLSGNGSLEEGKLITCLARPAMGKTNLASTIAMRVASSGYKVAFWSLEMKDKQIAMRVLTGMDFDRHGMQNPEERLTYDDLRNFTIPDHAKERLKSGDYSSLDDNLLIYSGGADLTAEKICDRMRLIAKREPDTALFIIDHLHLLKMPAGNEVSALGEVTRLLKTTAVELGVDVLLLCQLNRSIESRNDKMPAMSDARGSGRIEEDSDVVIGLLRPHYYDNSQDPEDLQIGILKNRQGSSGVFPARINLGCCCLWDNYSQ